jgi:hypothetical protein
LIKFTKFVNLHFPATEKLRVREIHEKNQDRSGERKNCTENPRRAFARGQEMKILAALCFTSGK